MYDNQIKCITTIQVILYQQYCENHHIISIEAKTNLQELYNQYQYNLT